MKKIVASALAFALLWSLFPMAQNVAASGTVASGGAVSGSVISGGAVSGDTSSPDKEFDVNPPTDCFCYTPPAPYIFQVKKAASLKKVSLSWRKSDNTKYDVYRCKGKGKLVKLATAISKGSYVDKKVKAGNTYTYYVVVSGWSTNHAAVATVTLKPGKIKGLKAKRIRGGVSLKWKKTKNVSGYQVQMKFFVKGFKTSYNHVKFTKKRNFKRKMLVKGRRFGFRIRAYKIVNGKRIYGKSKTIIRRAG